MLREFNYLLKRIIKIVEQIEKLFRVNKSAPLTKPALDKKRELWRKYYATNKEKILKKRRQNAMTQEQRNKKREYYTNYYKKNRDKIRQRHTEYYKKRKKKNPQQTQKP